MNIVDFMKIEDKAVRNGIHSGMMRPSSCSDSNKEAEHSSSFVK